MKLSLLFRYACRAIVLPLSTHQYKSMNFGSEERGGEREGGPRSNTFAVSQAGPMHSLSKLKHVPWSATTGCPASAHSHSPNPTPTAVCQVCLIHLHHLLITTNTRWRFFTFADLTSPSTDRHLDRSIDRSSPIDRAPAAKPTRSSS